MYYLTNRYFDIKASKGELFSLCNPLDEKKTQFVNKGKEFAKTSISYQKANGENEIFMPSDSSNLSEEEPKIIAKRKVMYKSQAQDGFVSVCIEISLCDKELYHKIIVTNCSNSLIKLTNIGIDLPCNSDFEWEEVASSKVIGHHYVGNHGSHSVFIRCDGKGPYLVMMPQNGTTISRFDNRILEEQKEKEKPSLTVFTYPKDTEIDLLPNEVRNYDFVYTWASDYEDTRNIFVEHDLIDVEVIPGYTVPRNSKVLVSLRCKYEISLGSKYPEQTSITLVSQSGDRRIYEIFLERLGVNRITVEYLGARNMFMEFFVTESIENMIRKRGAFIADKQHRNPELWYNGLLAEWNNKTGVMLGPDHYDDIKGWRIYAVTCDDPGLSKPAFLSGKLREYPVQQEVDALEYYVEHFVWGGLQQTEEEDYPYAIYGIPDWHVNRTSPEDGSKGKLHLWRIYDYPHIALMYYNLYRITKDYEIIKTKLSYDTYLYRAYRTALAMFLIPNEIEEWSAYQTGLYNECVIPEIIAALEEEDKIEEARRLATHWDRKVKNFVLERSDIFKSEYPFDTTGFESTNYLAKAALAKAEFTQKEDRWNPTISYRTASAFMENQTDCNISCRGWLEPTFYWYGSDYRGNNFAFLLSYMSQMGGSSLLDYALYYAANPYSILRLAYGSMLSSWALLNSGDEESNYGYWFPGKQHDGAAGGGFEPIDHGKTWLGQEHQGGSWYYSCEIDLGYCGALRGNAMIVAEDPIFGKVIYGGSMTETEEEFVMIPWDGVGRRFHYIGQNGRIHIEIDKGHFSKENPFVIKKDFSKLYLHIDETGLAPGNIHMKVMFEALGNYELSNKDNVKKVIINSEEVTFDIAIVGQNEKLIFRRV